MTDLAVIGDRRGPLAKLSDTARTLAAASLSANTRRGPRRPERAYMDILKNVTRTILRCQTSRWMVSNSAKTPSIGLFAGGGEILR